MIYLTSPAGQKLSFSLTENPADAGFLIGDYRPETVTAGRLANGEMQQDRTFVAACLRCTVLPSQEGYCYGLLLRYPGAFEFI